MSSEHIDKILRRMEDNNYRLMYGQPTIGITKAVAYIDLAKSILQQTGDLKKAMAATKTAKKELDLDKISNRLIIQETVSDYN